MAGLGQFGQYGQYGRYEPGARIPGVNAPAEREPGWPGDGEPGPGEPGPGEPGPGEPGPGEREPVPGRGRSGRYGLMMPAGLVIAAAGGGVGAGLAMRYGAGGATVVAASPLVTPSSTRAQQLARVAAAVLPSVVSIEVTTASEASVGSGVILRSDGMIVTNDHVVDAAAGGAGAIKVTFASGRTAPATIVGSNAPADLAVIHAEGVSGLTPATLGSVSGLRVGDTVLAIGSPLGLTGSVTSGIVSALHRDVRLSSPVPSFGMPAEQTGGVISNAIQTDTAINPGNSGGALVDSIGRVVGITTANATVGGSYGGQQSGSIGVGFAIPIDTVESIATRIMK